jgi:CRP/FNR family transcriptional regulator, cyclic AMP receptor protein
MTRVAGGTFLELLGADDVEALVQAGRRQRHPARSRVFEEGDPGYEVLIVEQGSVKLVRVSTDGRELVVAVRGEGAILGELSAIDGGVRSTSASTLTPVQLIAVSFERFRELLDTRAGIARALLDVLAERLRESTDRALELGTADALTRVCRRLAEFADLDPAPPVDGVVLTVPLSQQEIASLSGLSREAVVKALRTLRELGWIDVAGRSVTLLDVGALRERAAG